MLPAMAPADNPPKNPPTLKTIAFMTGLGISTVSRALKDGPEIGAETKARVKLIARQIGYRPNRAGVRLKTGKTNVITVVLNAGDDGSGFFSNFVFGISDALAGTPYHLVVTPYSLSDPMAPVRYIVETGSADGVIMSRTQPDDPRVRYLLEHSVPFATHGRTEMGLVHPFHDFDNEAFAAMAVDRLVAKGRRNLALLGPPPSLTYSKHTHSGFEKGLRRHGLAGIPLSAADVDTPLGQARVAARRLAERTPAPDGIVCSAVRSSFAVVAGFADAGLKVGRDFDIVTKHSTELLEMMQPEILAIPESFRDAGRDTARMVMAWIAGENPARLQTLVVPEAHRLQYTAT
jgi:LacI family transcriptional regulator